MAGMMSQSNNLYRGNQAPAAAQAVVAAENVRGASGAKGVVAPGFEDVARTFAENFRARSEVGAAFAAYRGPAVLADLWGGLADRQSRRSWSTDSLQLIFSGTKGLCAICILILVDRGALDLNRPVAAYWPEFGKVEVLVANVMSHTARLPGVEQAISLSDLIQDRHMARLLAAQPRATDPRSACCYHPLTYGWLCSELVRRTDGRSMGEFLQQEVAAPLGLEIWIGLPADHEDRVTTLEFGPGWGTEPFLSSTVQASDSFVRSIYGNPRCFGPDQFPWNNPSFHAPEIPGANGIATARAVARLYAHLVDTSTSGERLISTATMAAARQTIAEGRDEIQAIPMRYGVGFELQTELMSYGPPRDAFGHGGVGGSVHGAWPSEGVGFSYAMNLMRSDDGDARGKDLLATLHRCLGGVA